MAKIGTDIALAKTFLENGELVAIPTETVYGLAGNGTDLKAVSRIFEVKNRPSFDPLILHFANEEDLKPYVKNLPQAVQMLGRKFWPGPLTMLLEKSDLVSDLITAGSPKVAVRIPAHPLAIALLNSLPFPLAAPSANPFGYISPTSPIHVADQLGNEIPYILDGGQCEVGLESTIVDVTSSIPRVLRKGGIAIEDMEGLFESMEIQSGSSSRPSAPGMLSSHYAPKTILRLKSQLDDWPSPDLKVGVLAFNRFWEEFPTENQIILSQKGEVKEAAQKLFSVMRTLDNMGFDLILTELVPEQGLGRAINDKLRRASA